MAKRASQSLDAVVIELKAIHQKVSTSLGDLTARRITPELNEIGRVAELRIKVIEKRMRRDGRANAASTLIRKF